MIRVITICILLASQAQAAAFDFCWRGDNGYTMVGWIMFDDALLTRALITQSDVSAFRIKGYHNGNPIGSWSLATAAEDDTWLLNFDPQMQQFLTGGSYGTSHSQGWNSNGGMRDCGLGGFGFNSGNLSQDFCLNGDWVRASAIDPDTPFFVAQGSVTAACNATPLLGGWRYKL